MDFRELANGRKIRRPAIESGALSADAFDFQDEFDGDGLRVTGGEFADVQGNGTVARSLIRSVDLSGSQLSPLELVDVRFEDIELSNASWQAVRARRAEIIQGRALGLRISFASVSDVLVRGCRLDYAMIHVEKVQGALAFEECTFREATCTGDLSNVMFFDCALDGVEFAATNAVDCDLRSSSLLGARGLLRLRGARITAEQAVSASVQIAAEAGLAIDS